MGKINSRNKGSVGEREWRDFLRERGYTARRTQQYAGFTGDASDVICEELDGFHWEVKRVENLYVHKAMEQAIRDSKKKNRLPIVAHRKNRTEWLCTLRASDLINLIKAANEKSKEETDIS